jgi:type I restriction enzyme S subunit
MSKKKKTALVPRLRFPEFCSDGEWQTCSLGDISDRITEKVGDKQLITLSISAGIGFVSQAEKFSRDISGKQYENYIRLKKGNFSYNKGNSKKYPQGCIHELIEYDEAAVPNTFISFRLHDGYVSNFYKGYFDNNFHGRQLTKFITSGARSDGLLNINSSDFFSIILPTPKGKDEQKKIADCMSSLDDLINAEDKKLVFLKAHKKGLLQKLFPAEGETVPELRFPEFKCTGEWTKKTLGQLGELVSGLTYCPDDVRETGLLVLRSSNINNNVIVLDNNVYVRADIGSANLSLENDILICVRNGSKALIGKNAIIPKDLPLCTHGAFMTIFRSKFSQFVFQLLQSIAYEKQVRADLGATINSINGTQLKKYAFCIPEDQKEQQKIADCLSLLDDQIIAQSKRIEALKIHKKGLMQGLFPSVEEVGG